mmetsp:Transcript_1052/g.4502  ORF Transcript_1052/g.4502 Transcript_1052/m.4502 type:complete len:265 (-) Transcript_1052:464-1258(-)
MDLHPSLAVLAWNSLWFAISCCSVAPRLGDPVRLQQLVLILHRKCCVDLEEHVHIAASVVASLIPAWEMLLFLWKEPSHPLDQLVLAERVLDQVRLTVLRIQEEHWPSDVPHIAFLVPSRPGAAESMAAACFVEALIRGGQEHAIRLRQFPKIDDRLLPPQQSGRLGLISLACTLELFPRLLLKLLHLRVVRVQRKTSCRRDDSLRVSSQLNQRFALSVVGLDVPIPQVDGSICRLQGASPVAQAQVGRGGVAPQLADLLLALL